MREFAVLALEDACRANNVPLLVARSYGLVGYVRVGAPAFVPCCPIPCSIARLRGAAPQVSTAEHTVIESRPDNSVEDLRWAALSSRA